MSIRSLRRGFTLIELLLVIGIIAILAAIVIVAINPTKQLGDARNAQRRSDVNTILNAVYQYSIDNSGDIPGSITQTLTEVCTGSGSVACPSLIDLNALTTNAKYLVAIPKDPKAVTTNGAGYRISQGAGGRITVSAPLAEGTPPPVITVTR